MNSAAGDLAAEDPSTPPPSSGLVQSVRRAMRVLDVLSQEDEEMTLATIAARAELAAPTAHRLLRTLMSDGFVRQADSHSYGLGPALIGLGSRATPQLATWAQPVLAHLEELSHETANLAVLDGDLIAYVAQVASRQRMRMFTEVGRRALPHATGVGKAIMATLSEQRVREIVRRTGMPRYTSSTLTTEEALLADLRDARARGFAVDDGEQEVGVRCIAVAIPGISPRAAVSISGPAARITDATIPEVIHALQRAAATLGQPPTEGG